MNWKSQLCQCVDLQPMIERFKLCNQHLMDFLNFHKLILTLKNKLHGKLYTILKEKAKLDSFILSEFKSY